METKGHKQIQKKLIFYIEGELLDAERELVEKHLANCAGCTAYLNEMRRTLALLNENSTQVPGPYFYARIQHRIQTRRAHPVFIQRMLQPAMVVLLLVAGIWLGIWVGGHTRTEAVSSEQAVLVPFDDLAEEPIEEYLLNLK
jgi:anti-sigma factor RsiW